ncbi:hypothetical protein N0V84_008463 [Fusarium piperis]|uniref:Uncharacterized protein n=1 Tax=Fusarium piperis TaxID=1435070 RepID=A0A9W9BJU7_9HYPO|nr:hypothetical protein N0V84_008463 [Fusarium piperis]
MAALTFPPLHNLSQNPEDQESLGRIKAVWDEYSSGWDQETKLTILSRLHDVRATPSNRLKPYGHRLRKVDFDFGIWVMLRCIYPTLRMQSLRAKLVEKYPWIDVDSFAGPGHRGAADDMGDTHGMTTAGGRTKPDLGQHWQGFQVQIQDYGAPSSDNKERMIKSESHVAPDVNPQPPTSGILQSDTFANFLKRKAEDPVSGTPSKKPATRAASPVGFDSRSSFLDDEPDRQVPNAEPEVAPPRECCKLYNERCNAEFIEALEQRLERVQVDLKALVQRYHSDMKRVVNPPKAQQQQQQRRSGDDDLNRDELLEHLDTRVTRLEEFLPLL